MKTIKKTLLIVLAAILISIPLVYYGLIKSPVMTNDGINSFLSGCCFGAFLSIWVVLYTLVITGKIK